jgi:kynurenine formamidase
MSLADALAGARVHDLEQPRYAGAPVFPSHEPGVILSLHRRHEPGLGARTSASALLVMAEHSGTHIDALCHQAEDGMLHGGVEVSADVQTSTGFTTLGVDTIPPLIARGVLLDVAGALGVERLPDGHAVTAAELRRAAEGVELRPGDAVLVRLGSGAVWADRAAYEAAGGVSAEATEWVLEHEPVAVGADNLAWDVPGDEPDPATGTTLPGHVLALVRAGVYIVESLNLEQLAADGVREFSFVCLPLKLRGGTGSPVRPIAISER